MAITQNTLIGKSSGSVGGATFSSWKGKNVLRTKPTSVANPKSPGQVAQRLKMAKAVQLFRSLAGVFNLGYASKAVGMSSYNAFIKNVLNSGAISGDDNLNVTDFTALNFSQGTLNPEMDLSATATHTDAHVSVSWTDALTGNQAADDQISVIVLDASGIPLVFIPRGSDRSGGSLNPQCNRPLIAGEHLHVYAFAEQLGTKRVASSSHVEITVA